MFYTIPNESNTRANAQWLVCGDYTVSGNLGAGLMFKGPWYTVSKPVSVQAWKKVVPLMVLFNSLFLDQLYHFPKEGRSLWGVLQNDQPWRLDMSFQVNNYLRQKCYGSFLRKITLCCSRLKPTPDFCFFVFAFDPWESWPAHVYPNHFHCLWCVINFIHCCCITIEKLKTRRWLDTFIEGKACQATT